MNKYKFDENGVIVPYQVHRASHKDMKLCFVDRFSSIKTTRGVIWSKYINYTDMVYNKIKIPFRQMCFGSFITKKQIPTDIDIINIVHHSKAPLVQEMKADKVLSEYATDTYFIPEYEEGSPNYAITKALLNKRIKYGLYDDRKKKRQSMLEIEINNVPA